MTNDTVHNTVVARHDDGTVVILERTFRHPDGLCGATGAEVYPVSTQAVKDAMAEKRDYLRELADDIGAHGAQREAVMRMTKAEYLEHRFETYPDVPKHVIAAAAGDVAADVDRYAVSSLGRIFPRALSGATVLDEAAAATAIDAERGVFA